MFLLKEPNLSALILASKPEMVVPPTHGESCGVHISNYVNDVQSHWDTLGIILFHSIPFEFK